MKDTTNAIEYVRVTVQMTKGELDKLDRAVKVLAAREPGRRVSRTDVVRSGALQYADDLLDDTPDAPPGAAKETGA